MANYQGDIVQKTHYEPFGKAFEEEDDEVKDEEGQPYLYNGKELYSKHGLNLYDYHARLYSVNKDGFDTMDPHAENYYNMSPYAYAANNPINVIDPLGTDTTHVAHNMQDYSGEKPVEYRVQAVLLGGEDIVVVDNPLPEVVVEGIGGKRTDMFSIDYVSTNAFIHIGYTAKISLGWVPQDGLFVNASLGFSQGLDFSRSLNITTGRYTGQGHPTALSLQGKSEEKTGSVFGASMGMSRDFYKVGEQTYFNRRYNITEPINVYGENWNTVSFGVGLGTKLGAGINYSKMYTTAPIIYINTKR